MDHPKWWQTTAIYQIYPRSFLDSNDDGIGDLCGIARQLDHLVDLGVGAVWLSPIFRSPMADFGYDISDYVEIDPIFGTMEAFGALTAALQERGLKLILDLVPNHTSIQHPWFIESRSSRSSPKRNWYLWRHASPDGGPPNNWLSEFGGSAWTWDDHTAQYYYHAFLPEQPDLNWRNPQVVAAVHDVMRFWLRRGVDGFRVDAIWHLLKDEQFRDNPPNPDYAPGDPPTRRLLRLYSGDLPELHDVIAGLRAVVDEFPDRLLIGEVYLPIEKLVSYYGRDLRGTHLPFNFSLLETKWHARAIASLIDRYEAALPPGGWPNWVLGNHDRPRIAGRVGEAQARIAAMLLLTLRGTPTLYYGDEIGIPQVAIPADRTRDPLEKRVAGFGLGRDGARTPMQWDATAFAGFSTVEPWLPLSPDWHSRNAVNLSSDQSSILNLYRRLIAVRRARACLQVGAYEPIVASGDLLLFVRRHGDERMLVALNLGSEPTVVEFPAGGPVGTVVVSCFGDRDGETMEGSIALRGDDGLVIELSPDAHVPQVVG